MRDPDVLNVHGKNKKAKVVSFFLERIWKRYKDKSPKIQIIMYLPENFHWFGVFLYYVFFLIWLVCCASSVVYHENSTSLWKKIHVDFPGECWDELPDTQCLAGLRRSLWVDQEEEWCRNPVIYMALGVFPKIGVPQNGWFIMEKPIKMDDLEVPIIFGNIHMLEYIISWKQMSPNRVQIHPGYCFSSIRMLRCWRWKKKMGH